MPIETHQHANGSYRKATEIHVQDGVYRRDCKEKWVKEGNVWRLVFVKYFEYTADISGQNYNLRNACLAAGWNGVVPVVANLRVVGNMGATPPYAEWDGYEHTALLRKQYRAEAPNWPAFNSGDLPAGSEINLHILPNVHVVGAGGMGGNAVTTVRGGWNFGTYGPITEPWWCEDGGDGTPAIRTTVLTRIINQGIIGGGGGGGASGVGAVNPTAWNNKPFNSLSMGGRGGGGAGWNAGRTPAFNVNQDANLGQNGSLLYGGNGGFGQQFNNGPMGANGGRGGNLGENGQGGLFPADHQLYPQIRVKGGNAGAAVVGSSWVVWQNYGDVRGPLA